MKACKVNAVLLSSPGADVPMRQVPGGHARGQGGTCAVAIRVTSASMLCCVVAHWPRSLRCAVCPALTSSVVAVRRRASWGSNVSAASSPSKDANSSLNSSFRFDRSESGRCFCVAPSPVLLPSHPPSSSLCPPFRSPSPSHPLKKLIVLEPQHLRHVC